MHTGYGIKNSRCIQTQSLAFRLQFVSQHVQQHFRIGIGIDVAQILHEQLFFEFFCISQVAVVPQHDAERRIHIERLRLVVIHRRPGRWVTHMCNARIALQGAHIAGAKHIAHQAVAFMQMNGIAIHRRNSGSILTPML